MYVNADSIAIIIAIVAAAIALGTTMLASIRGVRQEARDRHNELRADMKALESGLRSEMNALESGLKGEMKSLDGSLRDEMSGRRDDMMHMEGRLRDEMQSGFKDLTGRVVNVGDRLSKVEGIIEGMFWGGRNQPADKPGEGAA